jgi:hypothetical protein
MYSAFQLSQSSRISNMKCYTFRSMCIRHCTRKNVSIQSSACKLQELISLIQSNNKRPCKDIFEFNVSKERIEPIIAQIRMHGGLNNLLKRNGIEPISNSKMAIEKARLLGLLCDITYNECLQLNKQGNKAKHDWEE